MSAAATAAEIEAKRQGWDGDALLNAFAPDRMPDPGPARGKAIIICCDGTANDPKQKEGEVSSKTNVCRLYEALEDDAQFGTRQIAWYDPGVGTETSGAAAVARWISRIFGKLLAFLPDWFEEFTRRLLKSLESGTGIWIEENIEQGYREIVRNFEPGDRIFIFGFSRGAYTARCIAGMIGRCGLLKAENIRFSKDAMTLFRRRNRDLPPPVLRPEYIHDPALVQVHVLGLWDTVASLGLPLWGWWFRIGAFWRNRNLDSSPSDVCRYVYHALSMDEQRSQFFPTVTTPDENPRRRQEIRQIWLRGAHADIGGGYGNRALGDIGLEWMLQIARYHGLSIRDDIEKIGLHPVNGADLPVCEGADPLGKPHDEIKSRPGWIIFGSWPRWVPVPRPGWSDLFQRACTSRHGVPHDWVYHRAQRAAELWAQRRAERMQLAQRKGGAIADPEQLEALKNERHIDALLGRDGLIFLAPGDSMRVKVSAASVWNRSGIVFEATGIYRVRYLGGEWRDAEGKLCGAAGQRASTFDWVRRLVWRSRRLAHADWMELIGHVAHPRDWPVQEFGLQKLLKFLFWANPAPLTRSLIRMGMHLRSHNDAVHIVNLASNGLFYLFANDCWATYKNNSGAIEIEIKRLPLLPPKTENAVIFAITPRGEVVPWSDVTPSLQAAIAARNNALGKLAHKQFVTWPPSIDPHGHPAVAIGGKPPGLLRAEALAFADSTGQPKQRTTHFDADGEIARLDQSIHELLEHPTGISAGMLESLVKGVDALAATVVAPGQRAYAWCSRHVAAATSAHAARRAQRQPARPAPVKVMRSIRPAPRAWQKSWSREEI